MFDWSSKGVGEWGNSKGEPMVSVNRKVFWVLLWSKHSSILSHPFYHGHFPKGFPASPCFWLNAQTRCPGQSHRGSSDTCSWKDFLSATTQCKIIFTSSLRLQNKGGWLRLWVFSFISIFFSLSLDRSTHEYNKSSLCLVS